MEGAAVADQEQDYDPSEHKAGDVIDELADASDEEKAAIAAAERAGKARSTVLKAAGVDPSVRTDASGRELLPHEVLPPSQES